jgi:hypothetical protein
MISSFFYFRHLAPNTLDFHCPFNPSHSMPQKTLIKHLIRCPDRPPHFRNCVYNISHVMPESELKVKHKTILRLKGFCF